MNLQILAHRLERLESQNNKLKICGILLLMIFSTGGFSFITPSPPKELVAERICLVDQKGTVLLKMELQNGIPKIILTHNNGNPSLLMSGEGMSFYDRGEKVRIAIKAENTLNSSCVSITDKGGKNSLTLSAGPEGSYLSIEDNEEQKEVILSIDPIGSLNLIERGGSER
jgi:hypothetical protein